MNDIDAGVSARLLTELRRVECGAEGAHALLLLGPEGSGKEALLRALAMDLLCLEGPIACQSCGSCSCLSAGTHPDWHCLSSGDRKQVSIEALRELLTQQSVRPQLSSIKVFRIHLDALTEQAQNVLLKAVEEPNPGQRFLLSATGPDQVLATLRSRCRTYRTEPWSEAEMRHLADRLNCPPDRRELLLSLAEGLPGRFQSWMEDPDLDARLLLVQRFWKRLTEASAAELMGPILDQLLARKQDLELDLRLFDIALRDLLWRQTQSSFPVEMTLLPEDFALEGSLFSTADEALRALTAVFTDLLELKGARQANASLETLLAESLLRISAHIRQDVSWKVLAEIPPLW